MQLRKVGGFVMWQLLKSADNGAVIWYIYRPI